MIINGNIWLNKVAVKLHKQFFLGMDFEHDEHRWIYEWDTDLTTEQNLYNVAAEDKALNLLTQVGVLKSGTKKNYFRDQQLESLSNPERQGIGMWGERWEQTDPAHREYEYIRFIDDLDYGKFTQFCNEHGINFKEDSVFATLDIDNQRPVVTVEGKLYHFKTLTGGTTLDIIELIIANSHLDMPTTFDDLRRWLKNPNAYTEQKYFTQIFRNGNVFHSGNVLSPFASIQPKRITLKSEAHLSPEQLSRVQKNSIN